MTASTSYRGRFAPSPTGPLHLGSLLAALASYLDARAAGGSWLLRIEDIDPPREVAGADQEILRSLRAHGLHWDEQVLYQSTRVADYASAVDRILRDGRAYYCSCSRVDRERAAGGHAADCPRSQARPAVAAAVRLCGLPTPPSFPDLLRGTVKTPDGERESSIVIRRKDTLFAYHLAVVVDDDFQRITHVVRGSDLLEATPHQLLLQQVLGLPHPHYAHLPLLLNAEGQKLSKQNRAVPLDDSRAPANLLLCLRALGQPEPPHATASRCESLLEWACAHWRRDLVPRADSPLS